YDPRFPEKQGIATELLRRGIAEDSIRVPHQAILEFVAAATRPLGRGPALLELAEARQEAEDFLTEFEVLYPDERVVRTAVRGAAEKQAAACCESTAPSARAEVTLPSAASRSVSTTCPAAP